MAHRNLKVIWTAGTILAGVLVLLLLAQMPSPAQARDKNCSDFGTQKSAQHWFNHHHPRRDPAGLDSDNDRIPCEQNRCPCSRAWHRQHGNVAARRTEASAIRAGNRTKVVCLDETTYKREYKFRPRHCIFHERHAPKAEAFFVRSTHDRWKAWRVRYARANGSHQPSMGGPTPVRIRLFHPVTRCGHRVFSKIHFRYPRIGSGDTLKLDRCAPS